MALRSRLMKFVMSSLSKVLGKRVLSSNAYEQTSQFLKARLDDIRDKTAILADSFEKELDLKERYRRIQAKLAEDLAELEMRKSVLEKEISADERMLFEEAYEHARKEIIERRMRQASTIFYPSAGQKLRDEFLTSFTKILRGDKQSNSPKIDEV